MNASTTLLKCAAVFLAMAFGSELRAQAFIPDPAVRGWLNQSIPGVVDANGIMDLGHPAIATIDSVHWVHSDQEPLTVDLTGIEHLTALERLEVQCSSGSSVTITIPSLPPSVAIASIAGHAPEAAVSIGAIGSPIDALTITNNFIGFSGTAEVGGRLDVAFAGIEAAINSLSLYGLDALTSGPSAGSIGLLSISESTGILEPDSLMLVLPAWSCDQVHLSNIRHLQTRLDLGAVEAARLTLLMVPDAHVLSWPQGLAELSLNACYDAVLPGLPGTLIDLYTGLGVHCLPYLPEGLQELHAMEVPCLPNIPAALTAADGLFLTSMPGDTLLCSILSSDCPGTANAMAGRHVIDSDANGLPDPGEPIFPWGRVHIQPLNALVPADAAGWWQHGALPGAYTITASSTYPYLLSSAPLAHASSFAALTAVDSTNHFAHQLQPGINDLQVSAFAEPARPGFDNTVHISYRNYGTTALNANVQLTFDGDQTWVDSDPAPSSIAGNTATWELGSLPLTAQGQISVTLHTDASVPLGTPLAHTITIAHNESEFAPEDNTALWNDEVVGSYDPNDKLLDTPVAAPADVQDGEVTLTYTIRFQNTGTYPAERVVILDSLSTDLDWQSFDFLASSHPCRWYLLDGVAHFIFSPIWLPDSASNEPASHGFVRFRIKPSEQLAQGDEVANIAHIVFDFNAPIVTPPAVFRVDASTALAPQPATGLTATPNPARDRLYLAGLDGPAELRVRDATGRVASAGRVNGPAVIDVAGLKAGIYLLEARSKRGTAVVRFMKE